MTTRNEHDEATTTQRDWHNLKPGDVVFFATGWYEVLDAYPANRSSVMVKMNIDGRICSYRVRVNAGSKATCRA